VLKQIMPFKTLDSDVLRIFNEMKTINSIRFVFALALIATMTACTQRNSDDHNSQVQATAQAVVSEESIFNLTEAWHTQNNDSIKLLDLQGKVLVVVMIYTSCQSACPRLVADMRDIESKMPKEKLGDLNFVLVSIDPEVDNPGRMKAFASENKMDANHWTFLQGTVSSVREFANVLSVKYKQISPMDFSHSNIISVFNREGVLVHQKEGLGVNNDETIAAILQTLKSS
jgi:protein SCO1